MRLLNNIFHSNNNNIFILTLKTKLKYGIKYFIIILLL